MKTERLKIAGMTCGGCTAKVTRSLEAVAGVRNVTVSLAAGEAEVQYDEKRTSPKQLEAVVQDAGYIVGNTDMTQKPQSKGGGCC